MFGIFIVHHFLYIVSSPPLRPLTEKKEQSVGSGGVSLHLSPTSSFFHITLALFDHFWEPLHHFCATRGTFFITFRPLLDDFGTTFGQLSGHF